MNVGTDESFLKIKFSQEIIEKCGWLKQMWAADEKHDSNKFNSGLIVKAVTCMHTHS